MAFGLGIPCASCGCDPPCPDCRHYIVDTFHSTLVATVTVDGYSVPVIRDDAEPEYTYFSIPGAIQSACFAPSDSPKRAGIYGWFNVGEYDDGFEISGCYTRQLYLWLWVVLPESYYYGPNNSLLSYKPTYTIALNCTDTGGAATPPASWTTYGSDISPDEDCRIELLDWLNSLTIVTTFSFDACECPP